MSFRVERRFNLLILEEGEEYLQDVAATMSLVRRGRAAESPGRLRVGSKSLVFQPDEASASILKFPFKYILRVSEGDDAAAPTAAPAGGAAADTISAECEKFVQVATKTGTETRIVTPFAITKAKVIVKFVLQSTCAEEYIANIKALHAAMAKGYSEVAAVGRQILEQVTASVRFDMSRLGHRERALLRQGHLWVRRVKPLLEVRGMLQISDEAIYFQPHPNFESKPVKRLPHADVLHVFRRTYGVKANALEIITVHSSCLYLCFETEGDCDGVLQVLRENRRAHGDGSGSLGLARQPRAGGDAEDVLNDTHRITAMWQSGLLSNYHYLDFLNCAAGRSTNDFSQYPVFPWVLKDFTSATLDLDRTEVYRDLARPIGALNAKRLEYFRERMACMSEEEKFLYGTHYSTPAYVIYWLLRAMPERMLRLHNGHFDAWPRLFKAVPESWESVNESTASLMELIPEFFVLPATWLENALGITTSEGPLSDVELPRWASGIRDFVCKHRAALESDHVSKMLPAWIDLIFGYKQTGEEAKKADNLFHPVCYTGSPGAVNSGLPDDVLETQLQEFGRMPRKLFSEAHPPRLQSPPWEPRRLVEDEAMSEPWYKVVRRIAASGGAASSVPTNGSSHGRGGYPSATGAGSAGAAGAADPRAAELTSTAQLQSLTPCAVTPLAASGSITGVACCPTNMYAIGEDGCLRVSPLSVCCAVPGDGGEVPATGSRGSASMRRNFRISPMPLSALAVLRTDLVVVGGHDNAVTMYSSSCGSALSRCQVHADTVTCLGVSPCGGVIVSGSRDQSLRTWTPVGSSLRNDLTFDDLQQPISCCAASRDLVLAGALDGQLVALDRRSGQQVLDRELSPSGVVVCALSEDASHAAALDAAGELRVWDLRHRNESMRLSVLASGASLCSVQCFLTDFSHWALVGGSGAGRVPAVALWGLPEQRELQAWSLGGGRAAGVGSAGASSPGSFGSSPGGGIAAAATDVQFLVRPPRRLPLAPSSPPAAAEASAVNIPLLSAGAAGILHVFT